jgi:hypothetical protein
MQIFFAVKTPNLSHKQFVLNNSTTFLTPYLTSVVFNGIISRIMINRTRDFWCRSLYPVFKTQISSKIRQCIQKFPDWADNEINNSNKHSLRSNKKGYGVKTHYTNSQNGDTTASSGRELYHLQFSLQVASPETSGYTLVYVWKIISNTVMCYFSTYVIRPKASF